MRASRVALSVPGSGMPNPNDIAIADRKGLLHALAQLRGAIYLLADDDAEDRGAGLGELQHRNERLQAAVRGRGILDPRETDAHSPDSHWPSRAFATRSALPSDTAHASRLRRPPA